MTQIAIVVYPGFTALDFIGPYEVLRWLPDTEIRFVWHEPGQVGDAVRATGFGFDGFLDGTDRLTFGAGHPDRGGELRLPAGPAQVHHQMPGHRLGNLCPVVVFDQRQR